MSTPAARALIGRRLAGHRLAGQPCGTPAEVVSWLCAVQSQDYAGAKWAIAQRTAGASDTEVEAAFNAGAILRTHVLRPTWHFVSPADIRWLLALTGPRVRRVLASHDRTLGIDEQLLARVCRVFERALRDRTYLTRAELAQALSRKGIVASGQRLARLAAHAELTGLICSGPRRGRHSTYALLDERAAPAPPIGRDEALATLARRYLDSHGPATLRDFSWWSGLTMGEGRRGLEAAGARVRPLNDLALWSLPPNGPGVRPAGLAHLLPNYDEYLVAYKDRAPVAGSDWGSIVAEHRTDPFGYYLLLDGRIAGSWRAIARGAGVALEVACQQPPTSRTRQAIARAARRYGLFAGVAANVEFTTASRQDRASRTRLRT